MADYTEDISTRINDRIHENGGEMTALELMDEAVLFALDKCRSYRLANSTVRNGQSSPGAATKPSSRIPMTESGTSFRRYIPVQELAEEQETNEVDLTFNTAFSSIISDVMKGFRSLYGEFSEEEETICSQQALLNANMSNIDKSISDFTNGRSVNNRTSPLPAGPINGQYIKEMAAEFDRRFPGKRISELPLNEVQQMVIMFGCRKIADMAITILKRNNELQSNSTAYKNGMERILTASLNAGKTFRRDFTEASEEFCLRKIRSVSLDPFFCWTIARGYFEGNVYNEPDFSFTPVKDAIWKDIERDILAMQKKFRRAAFQGDTQSEVIMMATWKTVILLDQIRYSGILVTPEVEEKTRQKQEYLIRATCAAMMDKFGAMFSLDCANLCHDRFVEHLDDHDLLRQSVWHYFTVAINPESDEYAY